jgi:hypothetical protein
MSKMSPRHRAAQARGIARAKAVGIYQGRKKGSTVWDAEKIHRLSKAGITWRDIAWLLGCSTATVGRKIRLRPRSDDSLKAPLNARSYVRLLAKFAKRYGKSIDSWIQKEVESDNALDVRWEEIKELRRQRRKLLDPTGQKELKRLLEEQKRELEQEAGLPRRRKKPYQYNARKKRIQDILNALLPGDLQ